MLIETDSHLYTYPITRDFGFAPNPFYGFCTLATCKPRIRKAANIGDWVMGIGGSNQKQSKGKCIFLMKVSEKLSFEEYWSDERFVWKKPVRNGSNAQMIGDNIYHKDSHGNWIQEDSHHSNPDGSANLINLNRDTGRCNQVLISDYFLYFGGKAIEIDLPSIDYHRIRDFKKTSLTDSKSGRNLVEDIFNLNCTQINSIIADPCQFATAHQRVNQETGKLS